MGLVTDVAGHVHDIFMRLKIHDTDWALAELIIECKCVNHSLSHSIPHLVNHLGAVSFLSFDLDRLSEILQLPSVFNFSGACLEVLHVVQHVKLVLDVVDWEDTPLELVSNVVFFARVATASQGEPDQPSYDPESNKKYMLNAEDNEKVLNWDMGHFFLRFLKQLGLLFLYLVDWVNSACVDDPVDDPLDDDPWLKRFCAAFLKAASMEESKVETVEHTFAEGKASCFEAVAAIKQ